MIVHPHPASLVEPQDDTEYEPVEFPKFGPIAFPEKEQVVNLNTDDLNPEEISALNTALEDYQVNSGVISNTVNTQVDNEDRTTLEATTTSETKTDIDRITPQSQPITESLKPITWSVGTGLIYVTYDQLQGKIMAVEDYLQMGKTKNKENPTDDMKGENDLSFLDDTSVNYSPNEENVKGHNHTCSNDENVIG